MPPKSEGAISPNVFHLTRIGYCLKEDEEEEEEDELYLRGNRP